jgi:hypothetical protein
MNEPTDTANLDNEQITGLPLIRTWRGVYIAVLAIFITWVLLLTALSRAFT